MGVVFLYIFMYDRTAGCRTAAAGIRRKGSLARTKKRSMKGDGL